MIRLFVTVADITAIMDAGYTVIRVYTDTSSTGDFTTLDGTITLVAATESYEYTDLDGDSDTWYKTAYYGAVPGLGDKSAARKGATSAAYATVLEFRNETNIDSRTDDVEIAALLDGVARAINTFCNHPDGFFADQVASARYYSGSGKATQLIDECVSVTAVAVKDSPSDDEDSYTTWTIGTIGTTTSADCFPASGEPEDPDFNSTPYTMLIIGANGSYSQFTGGRYTHRGGFRPGTPSTRGLPTVKVTGRWGYADTVPYDIKQANIMQASRWYKLLQGHMQRATATGEMGTMSYPNALDPDVQGILVNGRYVKPMMAW